MRHNVHIVQRQFIDLRLSPEANRPAVQQRIERMLEDDLLPRLERVFDRIAGPDVWVEMDKLEVDIGRLSPNGSSWEWLEQAHSAFVAAIEAQAKKSYSKPARASTLEILDSFLQHGYLPWWVERFDLEEAVRKELPAHAGHIARLFDNPLKRRRWVEQAGDDLQAALLQAVTGASQPFHPAQWQALLPETPPLQARQLFWESVWEAVPRNGDLVKNWLDILFPRTLDALGTGAVAALQTRIRLAPDWPKALKDQLITQLETYGAPEIIPLKVWESLLTDIAKAEARQIYETAFREYRQQAKGTWVQHLLWHTIAALPGEQAVQALGQNIQQSAALSGALKKELEAQFKVYAKAEKRAKTLLPLEIWQALFPAASQAEVQRLYRETLAATDQQQQEDWIQLLVRRSLGLLHTTEALETLRRKIGDSAALTSVVKKQLLEAIEQSAASAAADTLRRERTTLKKMAEAGGLYVPLAGIVLLHPFLPALFERSGLLVNESFRDVAAQERAVHLLYFSATGQQHPPESELPLLKMLCGWDMEAPISRFIDLNDSEIQEANTVLEATIAQWNALEGTTPDELRSGFLIREGKLQRGDLGWNLTVEQKGYDIIMNQLPWGLSPILHPWMREMLWVDWA